MSRSFAIWGCRDYHNDQDYQDTHVNFLKELHINFWAINSKKFYFLDFGLSFKAPKDEQVTSKGAICIYLPFKKNKEEFIDLSENLDRNKDLVTAIFNEYLINSGPIESKFLKIELTNKEMLVMNTGLEFVDGTLDKRVTISDRNDGTLVAFNLKNCLSSEKDKEHYIRFRLKLTEKEIREIVNIFQPNDSFLKSNLERTDIIDFRINEQRNLPAGISSNLAGAACTPEKYHFFVIRDIVDEPSLTGKDFQGSRILESTTWKKYFAENISFGKQDPMIYHWKVKAKEDTRLTDFSVVVKFKNTKAKITKVFSYLFYILSIPFMMKFIPTNLAENIYLGLGVLSLVILYIAIHLFHYRKS
ncbi:hypothetical protein ACIJH7_000508 [Yersinia enterocolitica]|uniref:hypothetical protein n=1 Tax=Yersinia enterocolitica TaxID=630 RepID=UPI0021E8D3B6|nr:hypothetical protein [Yersinia enterocolitica]UYK08921.1 hypothetical protein N4226_12475 [Yersinia enterocolitica]HDL7969141.1 hypothetical protein [Yersinia enterocolitica]